MQREKGKLRIQRKFSTDPSFVEWLIVIGLTLFAIGLALGLYIWIPLAIIGAIVAHALGYSAWLGLGIVGLLFLLRLAFGR